MKKTFGIRCEGLELELENIISNHVKNKEEYTYLEVGVASCVSFRAVYNIIKENIKSNNWLCIGLDMLGSPNVNFKEIPKSFSNDELLVVNEYPSGDFEPLLGSGKYHAVLNLKSDPRPWIDRIDNNSLDLVILDACHGSNCLIADFKAIENKLKPGGILMTHDCGVEETGTDWQEHCGEYINVRGGLNKLGLLSDIRTGWKLIKEIPGTRKLNNDPNGGNSMAVFEKL